VNSELPKLSLVLLDSDSLGMCDLLFGDLDPAVVEVFPLRSMVMEDLEYVHLVKYRLGAFQGETAALELGDELQPELPNTRFNTPRE
jgi:hypothetical protein